MTRAPALGGLGQNLAYVALVVSDVEAAASVFQRDFGLRRTDCAVGRTGRQVPALSVGESALALFAPDDPFVGGRSKPGVHHIALAAEDPVRAASAAEAAGVPRAEAEPGEGLNGARRVLLSPGATAGVRAYVTKPLRLERSSGGIVERIDHLGVASADNETAIEAFVTRLGCRLESTQTDVEVQITVESFTSDRYGIVHHARQAEPAGGLRVAFVSVGDCELEFLQELDPRAGARVAHDRPGTTRQDQGAIARFIAGRGPGLHHLALEVHDINGALAALARAGHALIDRVGRPGSRRALIGFIHPKSLYGVLVHLVQRDAL
ncbi:MAG: VOC family protein [Candidatus Rokubacteria bacterium]|nr:VOC family protein [Candidatus Rokubacteria bacterium]